ncbi:hypothetical protein QQ045_029430 [Rhodiola kirilowii]
MKIPLETIAPLLSYAGLKTRWPVAQITLPAASADALAKFALALKFPYFTHYNPTNTHIWLLWDKPFKDDILCHSMQHITTRISYEETVFTCSFIYASTDQTTRGLLWEELCSLSPQIDGPWFFAGDFNMVASWAERQGGNTPKQGVMIEFNDFMMQTGISDAVYSGCLYFQALVSRHWASQAHLNPMCNFGLKLKRLRSQLISWICETFGDVNKLVKEKQTLVNELESRLQLGWDDQTQSDISKAKTDLVNYLRFQFSILEEKARVNWIRDGERNTTLFHASIKALCIHNNVRLKLGEDTYMDDVETKGMAATDHFKILFGEFPIHTDMELDDQISSSILDVGNRDLCRLPYEKDIYEVIMKMKYSSAPGPDSYTGFLEGHNIHESIGVAHDLVRDINHKVFGGNIMLKLDMSKAYDRLSWRFLLRVMRAFGFSHQFCDLIYCNISNCCIPPVHHLLYADDLLLFSSSMKDSVRKMLDIIKKFCTILGKMLNPDQSVLFFAKVPSEAMTWTIRQIKLDQNVRPKIAKVLPPMIRSHIDNYSLSNHPDQLHWHGSATGTFSVKEFYSSRHSPQPKQRLFSLIWKQWIPPKISGFLWKLFHKVLPTDEVVQRICFLLPSRCRCCTRPSVETQAHLFIHIDVAKPMLDFIATIFDKPSPSTFTKMKTVWFSSTNTKRYMDYLALSLAYCVLWEVWCSRNKYAHGQPPGDIQYNLRRWACSLSPLIATPYRATLKNQLALDLLHIRTPVNKTKGSWVN